MQFNRPGHCTEGPTRLHQSKVDVVSRRSMKGQAPRTSLDRCKLASSRGVQEEDAPRVEEGVVVGVVDMVSQRYSRGEALSFAACVLLATIGRGVLPFLSTRSSSHALKPSGASRTRMADLRDLELCGEMLTMMASGSHLVPDGASGSRGV